MIKVAFFLLITLIGLSSCSQKPQYVFMPSYNVKVDKHTAYYQDENIKLTVNGKKWSYSPSDLEYYYTPIHLEVENLSDNTLIIDKDSVNLISPKGFLLKPIAPSEVVSSFSWSYPRFRFSISFGYFTDPFWFGSRWYPYEPYYERVYSDVVNYAFPFGRVDPKTKVKGFVYFPELKEKGLYEIVLRYQISNNQKEIRISFQLK
ncbi:MAG: hypothetical protein ACP5JX_06205 [Sulfurihydrogenibium sp.]